MKEQILEILQDHKCELKSDTEALDELLNLFSVSQQRELLLDYDKFQNDFNRRLNDGLSEKIVDDFLANNCG